MTSFYTFRTSILAGLAIMTVAATILFSKNVVANPLTNDDSGKITTTYRVHDVEHAGFVKGVQWAIQWAYNQQALDELLPMFGYKIGAVDSSGHIDTEMGAEFDEICGNADEERELDFLLALLYGKTTWNPSRYELGHAGIAFPEQGAMLDVTAEQVQPRDYNEEGRSSETLRALPFGDTSWSSTDESQDHSLTLGLVCNYLGAGGHQFNMREISHLQPGDRSLYLVTQNPIPDFDPDRLLWTNPSLDARDGTVAVLSPIK